MSKTLSILLFFSSFLSAQIFPPALEDNSFFIEEAYNQEDGIIQHIFKGFYSSNDDFIFSFAEEIPVFSQEHQFSFEVTYVSFSAGTVDGAGDLVFQYRYQLSGKEDFAAIAPAVSLIIPLGNRGAELGSDDFGFGIRIPVSKRLSDHFTAHFNAGADIFPDVTLPDFSGSLNEFYAGGSIIWLPHYNINLMLEYIVNHTNFSDGNNYSTEQILVPGIRYAIDIGDLQIVPALAAVYSTRDESFDQYVFYLSLEHPL